ncbi:CAZyme family GH13 [Paecilomyces variotii]|nr:CAZyme family GH13 [Paecilomyces variotii]KAJ9228399.1 CAZyme family GH13 [Paecilomyces variotii]
MYDGVRVPMFWTNICKLMDNTTAAIKSASEAAISEQDALHGLTWWQKAVVYQVLVPSFKDTNGDGHGDLLGIAENLDYLAELGINIVWLSPIFESPMADMGYDISDYKKVNPLYGTLEDLELVIRSAHERGLRIILDIALNHTSFQHEWFQASRRSRRTPNGPKKNWYIWNPGKIDNDGNRIAPNNWESAFGGSAWTWDDEAGEFYLHLFGETQPDLNWDCVEVRDSLYDILRWWLDKGIDGFRLDCMNLISKTPGFPDAPVSKAGSYYQPANCLFANGPHVHEYIQEMNEKVLSKYDVVTIGEMSCGVTPEQAIEYTSKYKARQELNLVIQFQHVELDCHDGDKWLLREWELPELKRIVTEWQTALIKSGGWNTLWTENHDQPRGISRFTTSNPRFRALCAKLLAIWLFTMQGTVFIYQGQELGMINPGCFSEELNKDIETVTFWKAASEASQNGHPDRAENAKKAIIQKGRDNTRVPIQWTDAPHGGFTSPSAEPWLPLCRDGNEWCIETQRKDDDSVYNFYREIIRLRGQHPTLFCGTYECLDPDNLRTWTYTRRSKNGLYLVMLNFSCDAVASRPSEEGLTLRDAKLIISNYKNTSDPNDEPVVMRPFEGRLYQLRVDDPI